MNWNIFGRKTTKKSGATKPKTRCAAKPQKLDAASKKKRSRRIIIACLWCGALLPVAALGLMLTLTATGFFGELPSFEKLENPKINLATEIYADNGEIIGRFFLENRTPVQYSELYPEDESKWISIAGRKMPPLAAALVATEDARYFDHSGIDFISLARVGVKTIVLQHSSQGGGSTITQQLAKNLFDRKDNIVVSKFKEWITALKLEYNYTKEEIIAMYLNQVEYGSNTFGIKSAAETFFSKTPAELNLQEAALLVGVVNAPTRYSPRSNPKNATARRNLVLKRIQEAGGISKAQCDSLSALPIELNFQQMSHTTGDATYFREMLRLTMTAERPTAPNRKNYKYKHDYDVACWNYEQACKAYDENPLIGWCLKNKKADGKPYNIYSDGLRIYTTINVDMQKYAEEAIQKQMSTSIQPNMDSHVRNKKGLLYKDKKEQDKVVKQAMRQSARYHNMKSAMLSNLPNDASAKERKEFEKSVEKEIEKSFNKKCKMKIFTYKGECDTLMTPRDSILHYKRLMRASFVAMEPQTGHVKAYVGGTSFKYLKYDMAKVGKRQVGSTVKPFIYNYAIKFLKCTPETTVRNLPTTIETFSGTPWSPKEAGKVEYDGVEHPLHWGLANSRNNYSAWIMKQAKEPAVVADFIHNMGVASYIDPVPSLCIGSFESNVYEMVGAYSTFANEGVYNTPIFVTRIEDKLGNVIASFTAPSRDAISKDEAYTMLTMMQKVITQGTGQRLIYSYGMKDVDVAGKTGTSNENRDGWFICVTPKLVAGTWVGPEDQTADISKSKAKNGRAVGGSSVALPIMGEFLKMVYANEKIGISKSDKFTCPEGWQPAVPEEATSTTTTGGAEGDDFFE